MISLGGSRGIFALLFWVAAILTLAVFMLIKAGKNNTASVPADASIGAVHDTTTSGPVMATLRPRQSSDYRTTAQKRTERIRALMSELAKATEDERDRERLLSSVLAALVDLDVTAAAELLSKIGPGSFRQDYLLRFGQLWAAREPAAALQWASNLPDETERGNSIRTVCLEIAQSDPRSAIHAMEKLGVPDDQGTLENLAQLWAGKDLAAATAWALARPAEPSRDSSLARVAYVMAEADPTGAASLVVNNMTAGDAQTEAAISIVHRWALQDWNAAQHWVDRFPEGPLRERAQKEITSIKDYNQGLKPADVVK